MILTVLPCGPSALAITTSAGNDSLRYRGTYSLSSMPGESARALRQRRRYFAAELGHQLSWLRQVHSATVLPVTHPGLAGEGDALIVAPSVIGRIAPVVLTADCVPVVIASESGAVRAAIHAGRRGLLSEVISATISDLRQITEESLWAVIGPHICAKCYQVSADLASQTRRLRPESVAETRIGKPAINLTAMAQQELITGGVRIANLDPRCTLECPELFSYRRDGTAGRLGTTVISIPDTPESFRYFTTNRAYPKRIRSATRILLRSSHEPLY